MSRPATLADVEKLAANKPHGNRVRYMAGCRCLRCRASNSNYETRRSLLRRAGLWNGLVSSRKARRHVLALSRWGVGYKTVAKVGGISKTVMFKIRSGQRKQIRALTEKRIMDVSRFSVRGSTLIPAEDTWRMIRWLLQEGFTRKALARRIGSQAKVPSLQLKEDFVTAASAKKVEALWMSFQ
jgi:hypothetical protein